MDNLLSAFHIILSQNKIQVNCNVHFYQFNLTDSTIYSCFFPHVVFLDYCPTGILVNAAVCVTLSQAGAPYRGESKDNSKGP